MLWFQVLSYAETTESFIKKSVNQHSQFKIDLKIKIKKTEEMDDFNFEDAGDQLDDEITEAMRVSLAEVTAPSPHLATKTLNQGMCVSDQSKFLPIFSKSNSKWKPLFTDFDDVNEDSRILAEILLKSKQEFKAKERLKKKEKAEIERALNESLKSQTLSIRNQDDLTLRDSALQPSTAAMPSTNIRYSKFGTSKSMSNQGHNSNKSATVTSVNITTINDTIWFIEGSGILRCENFINHNHFIVNFE